MFSHLKIIDLSTVLAGPAVATFFAELGAQVLKIENKKAPDVTRSWKLKGEAEQDVSAYFSSVNFSKKYTQLDLLNIEDYQFLLKLVEGADILISNFKFGDAEKLNVSDKILHQINPKLIIGKIEGFSASEDRVAYDLILQAETGYMSMNGSLDSGPIKMPVALIDVLAAHQLKEGLLLALLQRDSHPLPQSISVSLYDAAICSLTNQASNFLMQHKIPERIGSLHPNIAPYGELFQTADQKTVTFAIGSDLHFEKLCTYLNKVQIFENPLYVSNQTRVVHRQKLYEELIPAIAALNSANLMEDMKKLHIPFGIIKNLKDVFDHPAAMKLVREEMIENTSTKRITQIAFKWN